MKYRKKPVVIDAFQYDGDFMNSKGLYYVPLWVTTMPYFYEGQGDLYIETLNGNILVNVRDYIVRGVNGEFYPCEPDVFESTHEIIKVTE